MGADNSNLNLCVDLDRTLLVGDSTWLVLLKILQSSGSRSIFLKLPTLGWKQFKVQAVDAINLDEIKWNIDHNVMGLISKRKNEGFRVHLVTGSGSAISSFIFRRYPCFDSHHHSTKNLKLKGKAKAIYLSEVFGERNFEYVGDSFKDVHVWRVSKSGYFPSRFRFKFLFHKRKLRLIPL